MCQKDNLLIRIFVRTFLGLTPNLYGLAKETKSQLEHYCNFRSKLIVHK